MSLLTVILLLICTCTYIRSLAPNLFDKRLGKVGVLFGNVLGLAKERANMWLFVVSLWPLAFYFGHRVDNVWPVNFGQNAFGSLYVFLTLR